MKFGARQNFQKCLSFCSWWGGLPTGGLHPGGLPTGRSASRESASGGICIQWGLDGGGGGRGLVRAHRIRQTSGTHPTGMLSCLKIFNHEFVQRPGFRVALETRQISLNEASIKSMGQIVKRQ